MDESIGLFNCSDERNLELFRNLEIPFPVNINDVPIIEIDNIQQLNDLSKLPTESIELILPVNKQNVETYNHPTVETGHFNEELDVPDYLPSENDEHEEHDVNN